MTITDYNINVSETIFTIERNNNQWGEVQIKSFFSFMSEWKEWFFDVSNDEAYLVVPEHDTVYDKKSGVIIPRVKNVFVYTFDSFCKEYDKDLNEFFDMYGGEYEDQIKWDEAKQVDHGNPQEEAYKDFRNAQRI